MLKIAGLSKSYGPDFTLSVDDCKIGEGKVTALLGPNGSGKSTLLRIIAGLEAADAGAVGMDGLSFNAAGPSPVEWRRAVTLVMQSPYFFSGTVADNVLYGPRLRGCPKAENRQRLSDALGLVGLNGYAGRRVSELSGGEAQRVAVSRALALCPQLLLLDEPTANIDRDNIDRIERLISSLKGRGRLTVILATHDLEQAYRLSDEIISIIGGNTVPARPENVFEGTVTASEDGVKTVSLRDGVTVEVDTPLEGHVHVAIDPSDIILSRGRLKSSARNCLSGVIRSATARGHSVHLVAEAGVNFSIVVTDRSYREMSLHPGDSVRLTFKATAVRVF